MQIRFRSWMGAALVLCGLTGLMGCQTTGDPGAGVGTGGLGMGPGSASILLNIGFPVNSWAIPADSQPALNNLATAMKDSSLAGTRYVIQGHTDVSGRLGRNMALSVMRAASVKDYLVAKGINPDALAIEGHGPLRLLDAANPRSPANRRVEVVALR
jgi:outer membrane protein OmpA-like peptidoglycan-associated protein